MGLSATQRDLYALITGFGGGPLAAAAREVVGTRALSPRRRVRIYGDQYFWRMYEALTLDYPRLVSQLDERVLRSVVKRYARDCPSRHWDLGHFGAPFAGWLATARVPGARADFADLARLEWARNEAFLAPDATPIDAGAMAAVPAAALPAARLGFVPALRLLTAGHDVVTVFKALEHGKALPPLRAGRQHLVVWRKGFTVFHAVVGDDEARAIKAAQKGQPLSAVVAHFARREAPAAAAFAAVGSWVHEGMVAGVQIEPAAGPARPGAGRAKRAVKRRR